MNDIVLICPTQPGYVRPVGGKDMAMPVDKKRVLPAWMVQMAKAAPPELVKKPAARSPAKSQGRIL